MQSTARVPASRVCVKPVGRAAEARAVVTVAEIDMINLALLNYISHRIRANILI